MIENIRERIIQKRKARIGREGHTLGVTIPNERRVPLVPFGASPMLLCEVKRSSPSKGAIAPELDAGETAFRYRTMGAGEFSVLTEEDFFGGSLADLITVKQTARDCTVLRKDFLLDPEDIAVSFRAGADAVLLIAGALSKDRLEELYRLARGYGMDALVEVHSREDIRKAEAIKPELTGINARDLTTFKVDLISPLRVRRLISWETRCLFESGIRSGEDAALAVSSGFDGVLVGESVVRNPGLITEIKEAMAACHRTGGADGGTGSLPPAETAGAGQRRADFWARLYGRNPERPLIKMCGITRLEDLLYADELGVDMAGFILAPSPRRVTPEFIAGLPETRALKVGVFVGTPGDKGTRGDGGTADKPGRRVLSAELRALLAEGKLECVQLHGEERPEECFSLAFPYYKALRIRDNASLDQVRSYRSPRILLDAFSADAYGGTGTRIDSKLVARAATIMPLWLAGGITPENAGEIIQRFSPEMIDVSSGIEESSGIKNHHKMKQLIEEVDHAVSTAVRI